MHWLFLAKWVQTIFGFSISTPSCSLAKSMAQRIDRNESRLQQRGPPISPMAAMDFAVILWDRAKGSTLSGVEPEAMETFEDLHRVFGVLMQAQADDGIQSRGVAIIADVMASHTAGLAVLFLMADGALHLHLGFEIFQRRTADQAFIAEAFLR